MLGFLIYSISLSYCHLIMFPTSNIAIWPTSELKACQLPPCVSAHSLFNNHKKHDRAIRCEVGSWASAMYNVPCAMCPVQCAMWVCPVLYNVKCTMCPVQCTNVPCSMHNVQSTVWVCPVTLHKVQQLSPCWLEASTTRPANHPFLPTILDSIPRLGRLKEALSWVGLF